MKFALVASVAMCCLSAVLADPYGDPEGLAIPIRDPLLNYYCDNVVVTVVAYIRGLPEIMRPLVCFSTSFIDGLCLTTFSDEFCMSVENDHDNDTGDDETQVSTPGTDVEDPSTTITTTLTPGDVETHPTGDDEAQATTPATDVKDPSTTITTTLTPGDVEATPNPNVTPKPGTKSASNKEPKSKAKSRIHKHRKHRN